MGSQRGSSRKYGNGLLEYSHRTSNRQLDLNSWFFEQENEITFFQLNSLQEGELVTNHCCLQILSHSSCETVKPPSARFLPSQTGSSNSPAEPADAPPPEQKGLSNVQILGVISVCCLILFQQCRVGDAMTGQDRGK